MFVLVWAHVYIHGDVSEDSLSCISARKLGCMSLVLIGDFSLVANNFDDSHKNIYYCNTYWSKTTVGNNFKINFLGHSWIDF